MEIKEKEREEFVRICSDPEYKKSLKLVTVKDTCDHLHITYVTYQKWNETLNVNLSADERALKKFVTQIERLVGRNPQYANLYAKLRGYTEVKEIVERDFSPDEYVNIGIRLREELRRQLESGGSCPVCGQSKALRV